MSLQSLLNETVNGAVGIPVVTHDIDAGVTQQARHYATVQVLFSEPEYTGVGSEDAVQDLWRSRVQVNLVSPTAPQQGEENDFFTKLYRLNRKDSYATPEAPRRNLLEWCVAWMTTDMRSAKRNKVYELQVDVDVWYYRSADGEVEPCIC